MQFVIVGVGQTFNFETKVMEDILQVQASDGSVMSIPTTNEAAQNLIKLATNGNLNQPRRDFNPFAGGHEVMADSPYRSSRGASEDFPDGAAIFGGYAEEAPPQIIEGIADQEDEEPEGLAEPPKMFKKTQQTKGATQSKLGLRRNSSDRSGVPSYGIARVDEAGNPILPSAPDRTMDEEDDPGEQI
jgi:hypothetical protein